eukprot:g69994.t1
MVNSGRGLHTNWWDGAQNRGILIRISTQIMSNTIELENGGIKKEILTAGHGDATPPHNSKVEVHYVGSLLDGTKFDSSRDRNEPFTFQLGKGAVIKGWDKGVATMKKGEKAVLTCKPEYAYGASGSPPKIPPNATLQFEVELLNWSEPKRDKVTDDRGVEMVRLVEGDEDDYSGPEQGSKCRVHLSAHLAEDSKAGKSFLQQQDVEVDLNDTSLIWGVEEALLKMKKGEKCRVWIEPQYAYGAKGNAELGVGPGAKLVYEIELLSFTNPPSTYDLKMPQKLEEGEKRKQQGNTFFKNKEWARAAKRYESASKIFEYENLEQLKGEEQSQVKGLKSSCLGNLAQCKLMLKEFKEAIEHSTEALETQPNNAKNLFRRAKAQAQLSNYEECLEDLDKALAESPKNCEMEKYREAVLKRQKKVVTDLISILI